MMAVLSLLLPVAMGILIAAALLPRTWLLVIPIGAGIGCGIASCLFFALYPAGFATMTGVLIVEALIAAGSLFLFLNRKTIPKPASSTFAWNSMLRLAACATISLMVLAWSETTTANPYGEWDASAIWNLRAQFLTSKATMPHAVSKDLAGHPDYPLLTSALIAHAWTMQGAQSAEAPAAIGLLFALMTPLLLVGSLGLLRSESSGWLAVCILAGSEIYQSQTASQYADIPLAFYMLAAAALLAHAEGTAWPLPGVLLAGLMTGFAAWTKNEGMIFAVAATLLVAWRSTRSLPAFAAGMLPGAGVTAWFKISFSPGVESLIAADAFTKLMAFDRWLQVIGSFAKNLWELGFPWAQPLLLIAVLSWFLKLAPECRKIAWLAALPVVMLAAYFAVYLMTAADLKWHLETSNQRLFVQVWPLSLLCIFLMLRPPVTAAKPS